VEALEDAVERYGGTTILVSHDRALLRALATRIWILHDRRITIFDGSFAEWETASAEREHAASVASEEEEALRRVQERKKTRRKVDEGKGGHDARRDARKRVELAEAEVGRLEARVLELTSTLEDPALYATADGSRRAANLGVELERAKLALDAGIVRWSAATEESEALRT
jgi:ATP-binding cassette subfamily F protein 3